MPYWLAWSELSEKMSSSLCEVEQLVHVAVEERVARGENTDGLHPHASLAWVVHFDLLVARQAEVAALPEVAAEEEGR